MSDPNDYKIPEHLDSGSSTHVDSNNSIPAPQPSPSSTSDPMLLPDIDSSLGHHDFGDFDPSLYGTGFDDFNGDNTLHGLDFDGIELPLINTGSE